jgi:hypothetical protein
MEKKPKKYEGKKVLKRSRRLKGLKNNIQQQQYYNSNNKCNKFMKRNESIIGEINSNHQKKYRNKQSNSKI